MTWLQESINATGSYNSVWSRLTVLIRLLEMRQFRAWTANFGYISPKCMHEVVWSVGPFTGSMVGPIFPQMKCSHHLWNVIVIPRNKVVPWCQSMFPNSSGSSTRKILVEGHWRGICVWVRRGNNSNTYQFWRMDFCFALCLVKNLQRTEVPNAPPIQSCKSLSLLPYHLTSSGHTNYKWPFLQGYWQTHPYYHF